MTEAKCRTLSPADVDTDGGIFVVFRNDGGSGDGDDDDDDDAASVTAGKDTLPFGLLDMERDWPETQEVVYKVMKLVFCYYCSMILFLTNCDMRWL